MGAKIAARIAKIITINPTIAARLLRSRRQASIQGLRDFSIFFKLRTTARLVHLSLLQPWSIFPN